MRIQREGAQLQIRGTWSAGPGDDQARFLADLRALRDSAAIGHDEMAARAHYPSDVLKEAENGPGLPGLPILAAYVRACEGDVLDWEERWRRLNPDVPDDPDLPVRPAGASAAAVAGARAGVGVAPPDVYDPERIRAALRGGARSDQASRRADDPGIAARAASAADLDGPPAQDLPGNPGTSPDSWGTNPSWDVTPDRSVTSANGNHSASHGTRGPFDAALTSIPDAAEPAGPSPAEEFSWLQTSQPETRPADSELTWPERPAAGVTPQERTDFWAKPAPAAQADLRMPPAAPRAEEPAIGRASWPAPADTTQAPAPAPAAFAAASPATSPAPAAFAAASPAPAPAAAAAAAAAAEPAHRSATTAATTQPLTSRSAARAAADGRRQDRFFPARLLVVIVIAALIGSALVLLLK